MKVRIYICFLSTFASFIGLQAQNELKDTVKIPTVSIQSNKDIIQVQKLDSTDLESVEYRDLGELLARRSHLFIKSYGIGSQASISLRGSGAAHTQIFWNGISINSSTYGSSDLSLIPLQFVDEASVSYGLSSLSEGSGGIGGAVLIENKTAFVKRKKVTLVNRFGSFGQRSYSGQLEIGNTRLQSSTKVYYNSAENNFSYTDLTTEGFPEREVKSAKLKQKGLVQSLYYRPKEDQVFEAQLWWFDSERNLPPLITLKENKELQKDRSFKTLLGYKKYWTKSRLEIKSAFLQDELIYLNERASINAKNITNSFKNRLDYKVNLSDKFNLATQMTFDIDKAKGPSFDSDIQQERLSLLESLSYQISSGIKTELTLRELIVFNEDAYLLPSVKLEYRPLKKENLLLTSTVGKNAKYPSFNDLFYQPFGNENLKAEESYSVETNVNYQKSTLFSFIDFEGQLSAFYSDIKNYILWEPTVFGYWRPQNLDRVETKGIEFLSKIKQTKAKIEKQLIFTYSYTSSVNYEKVHEYDESNGKQLIYIPTQKWNLGFNTAFNGYFLSGNYQLVGERFTTTDNTESLPAYSLLNVNLGKHFRLKYNKLVISFGIRNLLNTDYQAIEWRPMPGRNYMIELKYQFRK